MPDEIIICHGEPCLHRKEMFKWQKDIVEHDGSHPDPIDNSPCDDCSRSK